MPKPKKKYICSQCNYHSLQWLGQCPECQSWDTFEEALEVVQTSPLGLNTTKKSAINTSLLSSVEAKELTRISSNIAEFDRVLGGGFVPGQVILIGGEPGIGKSTILTQVSKNMTNFPILYLCGEESPQQIKSVLIE